MANTPLLPPQPVASPWEPLDPLDANPSPWEPVSAVAQPDMNPWDRYVANPVKSGTTQLGSIRDTVQLKMGQITPEIFARRVMDANQARQLIPKHPDDIARDEARAAFVKTDPTAAFFSALFDPGFQVQSLLSSWPGNVAGVAGAGAGAGGGALAGGPVGAAVGGIAGAGVTSGAVEYLSAIQDMLNSTGMSVDYDTLVAAIQDPAIMAKVQDYALKRGAVVGGFDAVSAGVAGRLMGPVKEAVTRPVLGSILGGGAEMLTQGALGAAGEGGAQLATEGKITDPVSMAAEFGGEAISGIAEGAINHATGAVRAPEPRMPTLPFVPPGAPTEPAANPNVQTIQSPWEPVDPLQGASAPKAPTPTAAPALPGVNQPAPVSAAPVEPWQAQPAPEPQPEPQPQPQAEPAPPVSQVPQVVASEPPAPAEPVAAPPAPAPEPTPAAPAPAPISLGKRENVTTPDKAFQFDTDFEVVDASTLKAAQGADQPRDREGRAAGSGGQVRDIASKLDPLDLVSSRNTDTGAPIVDENGVVLSGNGRTAALRLAATDFPEKFAGYRAHLQSLGYDTTGMTTPILVRRARGLTPEQRQMVTGKSNVDNKQAMSAPERARFDVQYISPDMLAGFNADVEDGVTAEANADFVRRFIANMPEAERNAVQTKEMGLSEEGARRISNAIFAAAYADKDLIDRATESRTDPAIRNALLGAAGPWANMRNASPDFDVTPDLVKAIGAVNAARAKGMNLTNYLNQLDAFDQLSERVQNLAKLFYNPAGTRLAAWRDVRDRLKEYASRAANTANAAGDMFGAKETPDDLIRGVVAAAVRKGDDEAKAAAPGPELFPTGQVLSTPPKGKRGGASAPGKAAAAPQMEDRAGPVDDPELDVEDDTDEDGLPPDHLPDYGDDRRARGSLAPKTEDVSYSSGPSRFRQAWRAAGLDPDTANTMAPAAQITVLRGLLMKTFGFRSVQRVGAGAQEAIAQMLNAFRNVQFMLHVLELPLNGVSLGGRLAVGLEGKGRGYFGVYNPGTMTIGMPGQSNSFAHEWMHALDHYLLDTLKPGRKETLLSLATRAKGIDPSKSLDEAFINLVHAIFFDESALALKALELEREAGQTIQNGPKAGQPTQAALEARAKLDRLRAGATRIAIKPSDYRLKSAQFDPSTDYWASVHEMLARAFEAYIANKVEAAGGTNEFITKGDEAYLSDADRRLAMTFPKDDDRMRIFAAFDDVFDQLRTHQVLGTDPAASRPPDTDIVDPQHWNKMVLAQGEKSVFGQTVDEFKRGKNLVVSSFQRGLWASLKNGISVWAFNVGINKEADWKQAGLRLIDWTRAVIFSTRAATMPIINRNKGKGGGLLLDAFADFATRPGRGDYQPETSEGEGHRQTAQDVSKIESALRANGFPGLSLSDADNDAAYQMLQGNAVPGASPQLRALASALRDAFNEAHARAAKAGRKLGYLLKVGYVPRVIDMAKAMGNLGGFTRAAKRLYLVVFDDLVNDPAFTDAQLLDLARLVNHKEGDTTGVSRYAAEAKALRTALRAVRKAKSKLASLPPGAPRPPALTQALSDAQQAAAGARTALIDAIREPFARTSAEAWATRLQQGDTFAYDGHGPAAKYTEHRKLPPEAEAIMDGFYDKDVLRLTTNYVSNMNSRTAYHKRAGTPGGTDDIRDVVARKDVQNSIAMAPGKYTLDTEAGRRAIIRDLANPSTDNLLEMRLNSAIEMGADYVDTRSVRQAVEVIAGRGSRGPMAGFFERYAGVVTVFTYLRLLSRTALTALTEPATMYLRTGDAKASFNTLVYYLAELNAAAQGVQERKALARAIGLIASPLHDAVLMSRLGMDAGHAMTGSRLISRFWAANFGVAITNAQRRAVLGGGFVWMRDMAQKHQSGNVEPVWKKAIEAEFKELGVRQEDLSSFMDWLIQLDTLPDLDALNTKAGRVFEQAVFRFNEQVIQNPNRADKPMPASTALGRLAFGLTSFLYAFMSNVHEATVNRAVRNYQLGRDVGNSKIKAGVDAVAPAVNSFVGGFALIWAGQLMTSIAREFVFNNEQWEKRRAKGELVKWLTDLTWSRMGIYGPADVLNNALTGIKYERDLANILAGPGQQSFFSDLQNIVRMFDPKLNSPNTNTAEREAAKAFYRLALLPLFSAALSGIEATGPAGKTARWAGLVTLTSNSAAASFAGMVVGPSNAKRRGD